MNFIIVLKYEITIYYNFFSNLKTIEIEKLKKITRMFLKTTKALVFIFCQKCPQDRILFLIVKFIIITTLMTNDSSLMDISIVNFHEINVSSRNFHLFISVFQILSLILTIHKNSLYYIKVLRRQINEMKSTKMTIIQNFQIPIELDIKSNLHIRNCEKQRQ